MMFFSLDPQEYEWYGSVAFHKPLSFWEYLKYKIKGKKVI